MKKPEKDYFGYNITNHYVYGKTNLGIWTYMTPKNFWKYGIGLGTGLGKAYTKNNGKWEKNDIIPKE